MKKKKKKKLAGHSTDDPVLLYHAEQICFYEFMISFPIYHTLSGSDFLLYFPVDFNDIGVEEICIEEYDILAEPLTCIWYI